MAGRPKVGIVMGSDSDLPELTDTMETLKNFGIDYEIKVMSAHRTPENVRKYATSAQKRGLEVIIAAAGGAAHLAGVVASMCTIPVVGIPMQTKSLGGLDSLLSIVQMPAGVPVATVSIGKAGSKNAAVLAAQILGIKYPAIADKLIKYKISMAKEVQKKNKNLKK